MNDIFHPDEADKDPTNCERAVIALQGLIRIYQRKNKLDKALETFEVLAVALECLKTQYYENKLFRIDLEQRQRFDRYAKEAAEMHMAVVSSF